MGDGDEYGVRMLDRMPWSAENGGRRTKNRLRSLEEPYEAYEGKNLTSIYPNLVVRVPMQAEKLRENRFDLIRQQWICRLR